MLTESNKGEFMNQRIKSIKKQIELQQEKMDSLSKELVDAHRCRFLKCGNCGKKSMVGKVVGLDVKMWEPNTGSPNGPYWDHAFWAWSCPHCSEYYKNEIEDALYWEMYSAFKERGVMNHGRG